jgi:hypothetical protein
MPVPTTWTLPDSPVIAAAGSEPMNAETLFVKLIVDLTVETLMKPPDPFCELADTSPCDEAWTSTPPPTSIDAAAEYAFTSWTAVSVECGKVNEPRPPDPPFADALDLPSPGGGDRVRSDTRLGPSSRWLPPGWTPSKSMCTL